MKAIPATPSLPPVDRRAFLIATVGAMLRVRPVEAQDDVMQPVLSEADCPLEVISPVALDGHRGLGILRKPPGRGPFPAIIYLHGGITTVPIASLRETATDGANPSRFLAAGYVVIVPTYRSRDVDPQSSVSLNDGLATVEFVRKLPYIDSESIVVFGCSGGGDLALEIATRTQICVVVPEEPASIVMAGLLNTSVPKKGERYTPGDGMFMVENPAKYYTPAFQKILRAKVLRIQCPIFIVQGSVDRREVPINKFNAEVLIPELRAANKTLEVRTYPDQGHCFCAGSGVPRPSGQPSRTGEAPVALKAFRDIDAFCRKISSNRSASDRFIACYAQTSSHRMVIASPVKFSSNYRSRLLPLVLHDAEARAAASVPKSPFWGTVQRGCFGSPNPQKLGGAQARFSEQRN